MKGVLRMLLGVLAAGALVLPACGKNKEPARKGAEVDRDAPRREGPRRPGARTAPAPGPRPGTAPAPRTQTRPAPAESSPAKVKTAWSDAKVGWTVKARQTGGAVITRQVVAADAGTVTLRDTIQVPGVPQPVVSEMATPRLVPADEDPSKDFGEPVGRESLTVAGTKLECQVHQRRTQGARGAVTTRTYICREVPGWTVRVETDASGKLEPIWELVEFKK
jgi:hypothetical protein